MGLVTGVTRQAGDGCVTGFNGGLMGFNGGLMGLDEVCAMCSAQQWC